MNLQKHVEFYRTVQGIPINILNSRECMFTSAFKLFAFTKTWLSTRNWISALWGSTSHFIDGWVFFRVLVFTFNNNCFFFFFFFLNRLTTRCISRASKSRQIDKHINIQEISKASGFWHRTPRLFTYTASNSLLRRHGKNYVRILAFIIRLQQLRNGLLP